jgi:hypothetical protein
MDNTLTYIFADFLGKYWRYKLSIQFCSIMNMLSSNINHILMILYVESYFADPKHCESDVYFHIDTDPDPSFHFEADPNPTFRL